MTVCDGSVDGGDTGHAMAKVSLVFMDIVRPFASAPRVLAVLRVHSQTTRTNAENERILFQRVSVN